MFLWNCLQISFDRKEKLKKSVYFDVSPFLKVIASVKWQVCMALYFWSEEILTMVFVMYAIFIVNALSLRYISQ